MGGINDYVTKLSLACPVSTTQTWRGAVETLEQARHAAAEPLGRPLLDDCVDPISCELQPVIGVSDKGPCYRPPLRRLHPLRLWGAKPGACTESDAFAGGTAFWLPHSPVVLRR
jgi:hypothetical protein